MEIRSTPKKSMKPTFGKYDLDKIIIMYPGSTKNCNKDLYIHVSNLVEETPGEMGRLSFWCESPSNHGWVQLYVEAFGQCILKSWVEE